MKPSPNAAPTIPIPLARSSGFVMSAITAWAVEMLPPEMPSRIREANSTVSEPAKANITYPTAVPTSDTSSTGRRPTWSEILPSTGAARNCIAEYDAISNPNTTGEGPNISAYSGRIGITIPNPTRSMNTIRKTIPRVARRRLMSA